MKIHGLCAVTRLSVLSFALLLLVVLWGCRSTRPPSDAASLSYSFTVGSSGSGPWWQVQGQLNTEPLIYCDNNNSCQAIGLQRSRLSATKIWQLQVKTLRDAGDQFKAVVAHLKADTSTKREPLILQATMHCGHEVNGGFRASWDFGLNGQKMLHFDSSTRKFTEVDSESSQLKTMLEEVTDFLYWTSRGDCRSWLEEFKSHWEEKLEPTASSNAAPDVASKSNISVLLMILICCLLFLLQYL
ncbi:UL16-binding protein 1-like [Peromyscus maniculatus bairdii]|uniref:UL16-binding protein 1-like n=1 Tax=Peromyscus maniculatus bairdii TaxID=230844 RepID=UPI003FD0B1CC